VLGHRAALKRAALVFLAKPAPYAEGAYLEGKRILPPYLFSALVFDEDAAACLGSFYEYFFELGPVNLSCRCRLVVVPSCDLIGGVGLATMIPLASEWRWCW